ncbi:hypothetical protein FCV12_13960, partial [Clostridium botulinum]|nr:hypothetical protein [Clostridium botulinum]
ISLLHPKIGIYEKYLLLKITSPVNAIFLIFIPSTNAIPTNIISIAVIIFIIYNVNTDYYEDVLDATESKEQLLRDKKEGKSV